MKSHHGCVATARTTAVPVSDCACRLQWAAIRSPASLVCGSEIHLLMVLVTSKVLPCGSPRLNQLSDIPAKKPPTSAKFRDNGKQHAHSGVSSDRCHRGSVSLIDIYQLAGAFVSPFGRGAKDIRIRVSPVPAVVRLSSSCDIAML